MHFGGIEHKVTMSKIQNFAEITPNLPFSEFNFYDLYRDFSIESQLRNICEIPAILSYQEQPCSLTEEVIQCNAFLNDSAILVISHTKSRDHGKVDALLGRESLFQGITAVSQFSLFVFVDSIRAA